MRKYSQVILEKQKKAFTLKKKGMSSIQPLKAHTLSNNQEKRLGEKLLIEGKVGTLILAGGLGSRLGFEGPKGAFIFPHLKKSLFEILFNKIKKASLKAARNLPVAIMTSEKNHEATLEFLEKHTYFGFPKEHVDFFTQESLPYLDDNGEWIQKGEEILDAPEGNGKVFHSFFAQGLLKKWKAKGVEQITVIPIDNPLADPFDSLLCGFHFEGKNDVTLKCIQREDPQENVGLVVYCEDKIRIVEYTELCEEDKALKNTEGRMQFSIANAGLYSFSLSFIEKVIHVDLPLHFVKKQVSNGHFAWKGEYYIFDLLEYAFKIDVLVYPRQEVFCPLKTRADILLIEKTLSDKML